MGQSMHRCVRSFEAWTMLTTALVTLHIAASGYIGDICTQVGWFATISCGQDEIIRIHQTMLSAVSTVPGQPVICENPDENNYCRAPTNRSDLEFKGRQSSSYRIQAEDLNTHPDRKGDCYSGVRANLAQVFYECIPAKSGYLQSVCSDILWENEVSGYLTSPYFPGNYPNDEQDLECHCELRPDEVSRVELTGLLMNPSSSGIRWSLEAENESGSIHNLSTQFYASRKFPHLGGGSVTLRFRSEGSGQQQAVRKESPSGFWLEYKGVLINKSTSLPGAATQSGRVTIKCNDPYKNWRHVAGLAAGLISIDNRIQDVSDEYPEAQE